MSEFDEETPPHVICEKFLLESPPGQFGAVLSDLKLLHPALGDDLVDATLRQFNDMNLRVADAGGHAVVTCPAGRIDEAHYVDAQAGAVVTVDHKAMTAERSAEPPLPGATPEAAALRDALQGALDAYAKRQFPDAAAATFAKDASVSVVISAEKLNLKNYWSGQWTSQWVVALGGGGATLAGEVKVHGHYFEDGNVQLVTEKKFAPAPVAAVAAKVCEEIERMEGSVQEGLEAMYSSMSEDTFKAMRRVMPITRTKMNWSLSDVKLKQNLTAKR